MNSGWSRWLSLPVWVQGSLLCMAVCASALCVWHLWAAPADQQAIKLLAQHRLQSRRYQLLVQRLMASGSFVSAREEIAQLQQALQPEQQKAFSLLTLTQISGGELADWQPSRQGGSLTLDVSWPQVESLFGYLSTLPAGVTLSSFTLKPEHAQLRFHLTLALNHED
ncbi:HofO family protein [Erwinia billingiae]|uniref:HofO family protein n=1 Tax=Erwinia billingiae TaxID=182337 RepID=UPI000CFE73C1|nr:hypothetical protein [Erwinia billingiae]PRB58537.1 hypothetical protein CQ001_13225 [Erwinia billingiae]